MIPGNVEETVQNISTHGRLFVSAICCYLICFIEDIVIAWPLYYLLLPVNRALSLLTAWFRLIYAAIVLVGTMNLVTVDRLLTTPYFLMIFGRAPLHAQVDLLLHSFRYDWSLSLGIFGIHLVLLGYLVARCGYISLLVSIIVGILLVLDGLGWIADSVQPYLYPNTDLAITMITPVGELIFMLWLFVAAWRIREPAT